MAWCSSFRTIGVLAVRELFRMQKEPTRLLGVVVQPLLFWLVIGFGFAPAFRLEQNPTLGFQPFFYPGVLAMVILFCAIFSTMSIIEDKDSGFLQAVLVGPGSRAALVIGKVSGVVAIALIQVALFLLVAPYAGISFAQIDWLALLAVVLLGSFVLSALGFIFAWGTGSSAAYHALMGIVLIPMWILSGAIFPVASGFMEKLAWCNPLAWLVAGLRAALNGGVAPVGTIPANLVLWVSLTLLLLCSIVFTFFSVLICQIKR